MSDEAKSPPEKISPSELSLLRELALERPLATLDELVKVFQSRSGLQVHSTTLRKALMAAGITRAKLHVSRRHVIIRCPSAMVTKIAIVHLNRPNTIPAR